MYHSNHCEESIYYQPWVTKKVRKWLDRMSIDDKINQTFMVPAPLGIVDPTSLGYAIGNQVGAFIVTAPLDIDGNKIDKASKLQQINMIKEYTNYGIPAIFGYDNTHGATLGKDAVVFPQGYSFDTLARDKIKEHAYNAGVATGYGSLEAGINMVFAPFVSTVFNQVYGRNYESPGRDADKASRFGEAWVKGAQQTIEKSNGSGKKYLGGVIACCKHFYGEGRCELTYDPVFPISQYGAVSVDIGGQGEKETLLKDTAAGFMGGVRGEVGAVMIGYNAFQYNPLPNSFGRVEPYVVYNHFNSETMELLRLPNKPQPGNFQYQIGFNHKGFIIADSGGPNNAALLMGFPRGDPETGDYSWPNFYSWFAYCLAHGVDMLMFIPDLTKINATTGNNIYDELREYIKATVCEERINNAVENILRVKVVANLDAKLCRTTLQPTLAEQALNAYKLAFNSFVYTTNLVDQTGADNPLNIHNAFPLPKGPLLADRKKTVLLLGREGDPNAKANGGDWNAFYNDIGLQNGGWSFFFSDTGVTGNRTIFDSPPGTYGSNINELYPTLFKTVAGRSQLGTPIKGASTILTGLLNIGVKSIVVEVGTDYSQYNADNAVGILALGEFAYQEIQGELDHRRGPCNTCDVLNVNVLPASVDPTTVVYNSFEGVKLTVATYNNLKAAYKAGIPIVAIIMSGRDWRTWNTGGPLYAADNDPFGQMSLSQVTTGIVFAILPGTSGGDALVNFLYDTPYKQDLNSAWRYTSQNAGTIQLPVLGNVFACPTNPNNYPPPCPGQTNNIQGRTSNPCRNNSIPNRSNKTN